MMLTMIGTMSFAQVIFQIQAPSTPVALQNTTYPLTWADPAGGDWATPDLNIPANSVTAPLEFVDDGDGPTLDANGNPLGQDACTPLINNLTGKIAVLYRGACEFGFKAEQAQDAGAVAVIIINHTGAPVGMGGGTNGPNDTIPVIMISEQDGDNLKADIAAGTITQAFIGNKAGIFADDLGIRGDEVMRARRFSNLAGLSQNASEFSVPVGAWVRNIGNQSQTGATLSATIDNGSQIYNQSATVPTLAPGDSAWVSLPTFSQASYPVGVYTMDYTVATNPNPDGEPSDNVIDATFMISDSIYAYGKFDAQGVPVANQGFTASGFTNEFEACIAFQDANASRMRSIGMTAQLSSVGAVPLTNEFIEATVYQWDDVFTDINDPGLNFSVITELDAAFFVYGSDLQNVPVFVAHSAPITLIDNTRYLFCITTPFVDDQGGNGLNATFVAYNTDLGYSVTQDDGVSGANGAHLQPSTPIDVDGGWSLNGFGLDVTPTISVQMDLVTGVEELNNEITVVPFPNPTVDVLNIPVGDRNGNATIEIFDVAGKLAMTKTVTFTNNQTLTLDVSNLSNGSYVANMIFEDGTAKFNVVVNK